MQPRVVVNQQTVQDANVNRDSDSLSEGGGSYSSLDQNRILKELGESYLPGGSIQYSAYYSTPFKHVLLIATLTILMGFAMSIAFVFDDFNSETPLNHSIGLVFAFAPIVALLLVGGVGLLTSHLCAWLHHLPLSRWRLIAFPALLSFIFGVAEIIMQDFNPLSICLLFFLGLIVTNTLREHFLQESFGTGSRIFTWTDLAVWMLLLFPREISWNLWTHFPREAYQWWAMAMSVYLVIGWKCLKPHVNTGFSLIPTVRDVVAFLVTFLVVGVAAFPFLYFVLGIALPANSPTLLEYIFSWIRLFLSSALPLELFFRAVLYEELYFVFKNKIWAVMGSNAVYALVFWPKFDVVWHQLMWTCYALVSGSMFGASYVFSGQLLAGALVHTCLDFVLCWFVEFPYEVAPDVCPRRNSTLPITNGGFGWA